ncbi:MAG: hypothetical protein AAFY70_01980 [Bacteroidota bacterium]
MKHKIKLSYEALLFISGACRNVQIWIKDFPTEDQNYRALIYDLAKPIYARVFPKLATTAGATMGFYAFELRFLEACALSCTVIDPITAREILTLVQPKIINVHGST